jgi:hypothetical protein
VPIQPSEGEFDPEKADVTLESHHYLTADQQRVLIQNGTYMKILKKWSATQGAISQSQINAAVS